MFGRIFFLVVLLMPALGAQAATMYNLAFTAAVTGNQTSTETGTGTGLLTGNFMEYSQTSVFSLTSNVFGIENGTVEFTRSGEFDFLNLTSVFSVSDCTVLSGSSSLCTDFGIPLVDIPLDGFAFDASSGAAIDVTWFYTDADLTQNFSWHFSAVPIPAAAWLFGSALLGLGAMKRKKA